MKFKPNNKIVTPRPYLSWSQYDLWNKSPKEYINRYIYGKTFKNQAMELGSEFAEALEGGEIDNPIWETIRIMLGGNGIAEFQISTDCEGVPLYGKMDNFNEITLCLEEYKTGQSPWTQSKVDKSGQITFYCLMIWLKYKKIPDSIKLCWLPTEKDENGKLNITGQIITFPTQRKLKDILVLIPKIKRTWQEISIATQEEYSIIK